MADQNLKHPAEVLAQETEQAADAYDLPGVKRAADMLRRIPTLEAERDRLLADAARLDWLADPSNFIGNVQLPAHCVAANLHSMRAAIDMAMRESETKEPK